MNCDNENAEDTIFCHHCLSLLKENLPLDYRERNFDRLRLACFYLFNDEISKDDFIELLDAIKAQVEINLAEMQGMEIAPLEIEKEIGPQRELTVNGMVLFLEGVNLLYTYPERGDFEILEQALNLAETGNSMLNEAIRIIREQEGIQGEGVLNLEL
ncbi:MAG: hypothetical protein RDV48_26585 [Candidatus Eremiobacteraeota bacterium]|nr:hypothetical protein [Candidatus Eremiobacteraeota bacterium]